jgi:hypothetical protein
MNVGTSPYVFDVFAAATAVGVLIQAGVLLALLIAFLKLTSKLDVILKQVTEEALPLVASTKVTLEELTPKLKTITANLAEVSETLKHESQTIKISVDEVLEKTRAQTARVDEMVSGTLDGISHASATIQQGIEVPMRHIYGIFNGLKAAVESLRSKPTKGEVYTTRVEPAVEETPVFIVDEVIVVSAKAD